MSKKPTKTPITATPLAKLESLLGRIRMTPENHAAIDQLVGDALNYHEKKLLAILQAAMPSENSILAGKIIALQDRVPHFIALLDAMHTWPATFTPQKVIKFLSANGRLDDGVFIGVMLGLGIVTGSRDPNPFHTDLKVARSLAQWHPIRAMLLERTQAQDGCNALAPA